MPADTAWDTGRLKGGGPPKVLFARVYEDPYNVELKAFAPGGRVMCIASAGDTARVLAQKHEVVAIDINPVQLQYAERRLSGEPMVVGSAEKILALGRALYPIAGWPRRRVEEFLNLEDPAAQERYWREHLDTRAFRIGMDVLFSFTGLKAVFSSRFLSFLPPRFGRVMRLRMERCFFRHPNRTNPWARALMLGELSVDTAPAPREKIELVLSDAAAYLEGQPEGSFSGIALSNILDGAEDSYRRRLFAAVRRAAAKDATVILRSFGEPNGPLPTNRAEDDRSLLWGVVDVRPAATLE